MAAGRASDLRQTGTVTKDVPFNSGAIAIGPFDSRLRHR
jgi:hypothetical protein